MTEKGPAAYIAEFVGTFFLVLAICGVVSAGAPHGVTVTDLGLVHTFALMVMVYAIGSISGRDAGIYIACQLAGGICAGLLVKAFFNLRGGLVNFGAPALAPSYLHGG